MSLQFQQISQKSLKIVFFIQIAIYYAWFIFIFGVLGHVCPVANLGMWTASLVGCVAFTGKRPRALGTFLSLIATAIIWAVAFLFLHPNEVYGWEVEDPYRYINPTPFIMLAINIIVNLLIQIGFTRTEKLQGPVRSSQHFELLIERFLGGLSFLITAIVGVAYITVPWVKQELWNDDITDWFDTVFYEGEVYWLFYFLAIIALFSGIMMGIHYYAMKKGNIQLDILSRILGYTFLGLLLIGTIGIFIYLGTPQNDSRKNQTK